MKKVIATYYPTNNYYEGEYLNFFHLVSNSKNNKITHVICNIHIRDRPAKNILYSISKFEVTFKINVSDLF